MNANRIVLAKRQALLVILAVVVAGSLAACGGSSPKTVSTTTSPAVEKAQIKSAYEKFFSSKTSLADRVALLENGTKFKSLIESFASNPLATNTSATVSSVTLEGANTAKVVYTVHISGAALGKQTGSAVRQNGQWKVGSQSLCKLIALGGTTPSVCKKS
jgi:hypothetical protein